MYIKLTVNAIAGALKLIDTEVITARNLGTFGINIKIPFGVTYGIKDVKM